ncbi:MAG: serine/threonine-protein phosphatase [Actinobacteria bacterium]|nr:serine/threonine-protein phosphatase [Actinomycetota bacterium]
MKYTWSSATHVGLVRESNQDSVAPVHDGSTDDVLIAAVADGMGGAAAGDVASRVALAAAIEPTPDEQPDPTARVTAGNEAVLLAEQEDTSRRGMGTTLTLGMFHPDGHVDIGHVGDSRMYLFRDGRLTQVTDDHSFVGELVRAGKLNPTEAMHHPRRNIVTRVLGTPGLVADRIELHLNPGDRVLICSDGLTDMVTRGGIEAILADTDTVTDAAWGLVEAANRAGGVDNTTVVVVDASQ